MAMHFYSFTDPRELASLEVCWTQAAQTAVDKRRQIRPRPGMEPRAGHAYGEIRDAVMHVLRCQGAASTTDIMDELGWSHSRVSSALHHLCLSGKAVRVGPGYYEAPQKAPGCPQRHDRAIAPVRQWA
jgi:hypothetical protein